MLLSRFGFAVGLLASLFLLGCGQSGPPRATVTGQVKYKGEPLPMGSITFVGENNVVASAPIQNGSYTMPNAPVGKVKIAITTPTITPQDQKQFKQVIEGKTTGGATPPPKMVPVPEKYTNPETSTLTYTVTTDPKQSHDIELK